MTIDPVGLMDLQDQPPDVDLLSLSTEEFLANIEALAKSRFDCRTYPQQMLPLEDWALLARAGVMLPALPKEFGGRDSHVEMCRIIERITEYNLPIGMYTMIITAAVLRPLAMRGSKELQREILPLFAKEPLICGFALTEPGCGSNMARMITTYEEVEGGYRIRGQKHWQGFSPTAHWWLVTAKNESNGKKKYGYFAVKRTEGFNTIEQYDSLGLKAIGYGLNEIDAFVPKHRRIDAEEKDLSAVVEMLMPPRVMMGALGCGFLKRVYREALARCDERRIGPGRLSDIRFTQYRLKTIEAAKTLCEVLYDHLETQLDLKVDMAGDFFAVQCIKILSTERMLRGAYQYQHLCGNEGYRYNAPSNMAGQMFLDAEIYPVLDGTNDLLSQQVAEGCLKRCDGQRLSNHLASFPPTARGIVEHQLDLKFLDRELKQEHLVLAGRAIAAVFGISEIVRWTAKGGAERKRTGRVAAEFLKQDLAAIASEFALLDQNIL
jgi:alkylation response protein AidB-like acyl-CoA dehydrogenase